jgi:hypothetical protein
LDQCGRICAAPGTLPSDGCKNGVCLYVLVYAQEGITLSFSFSLHCRCRRGIVGLPTVSVCGQQTRQQDELPEHFAQRVQQSTAHAIGLAPTNYTASDKAHLRKQHYPGSGGSGSGSHRGPRPAPIATGADGEGRPLSPAVPNFGMTPSASAVNLADASSVYLPSESRAVLA